MTQKFTKNISHTSFICADYSIAINTTNGRQQFSAVTVSLKSGFLRFFFKNLKTLKFGLLPF